MNRIEARIIIMVTNRLAAAKDSEAKTEMIEELSENLYQRYLELVEGGAAESDALKQALESLGDVEELLAFLREEEKAAQACRTETAENAGAASNDENGRHTADAAGNWTAVKGQPDAAGGMAAGDSAGDDSAADKERDAQGSASQTEGRTSAFSVEDLENGIEEIVNAAISMTKVAVDCARDVAKDVSGQFKERYPDGVFPQFSGARAAECMTIPVEDVEALEIRLTNGDIRLGRTDETDVVIEIEGDVQDVKTMLKENGVLSVTQGNTASAAFLFMKGIRRTNVELGLPEKLWESVSISTTNGDIDIEDELACRQLKVTASSGDLSLECVSGENMELKLCSGDIKGDDLNGNLHAESKSGDIEISGCLDRCEIFSASGDVEFEGASREMNCSSTSGDVKLSLEQLPEKLKGNSVSGDCGIILPAGQGFHLSYRTVSGSFSTDIPLSGRMEKKCGDVFYGETVCGDISLSSVSGDINVRIQQ